MYDCCYRFACRSCKAVSVSSNIDPYEVVRHASKHSDPMYQFFRENRSFIGANAMYCCFHHPDKALRSSLKLLPIVADNGNIDDIKSFVHLIEHCIEKSVSSVYHDNIQLLLSYKPSYSPVVLESITKGLFDELRLDRLCLMNESVLISNSLSTGTSLSAVIVDIGAYRTTVTPIYEGMILHAASCASPIGN